MKKIIFCLFVYLPFIQSGFCITQEEINQAWKNDDPKYVSFFLHKFKNIDTKNPSDKTELHEACYSAKYAIAKALIEKGSNVNAIDNIKYTPLHWVCISPTQDKSRQIIFYNIAKLLIESGADVNAKGGESAVAGFDLNHTPLHFAAKNGNFEMVKFLVENGADINVRNFENFTPLHTAIVDGKHNRDLVIYLISKGADVNSKDKSNGNTLFFESLLRWKDLEISKMILDRGADINEPNKEGKTPLHYAVSWRNSEKTVEFLLANGADLNKKTKLGDTALRLAKEKGNKEIIELLIKAQKEQSSGLNSNNVKKKD